MSPIRKIHILSILSLVRRWDSPKFPKLTAIPVLGLDSSSHHKVLNVVHIDAEDTCRAFKFYLKIILCNKAKTLQLFFAPLSVIIHCPATTCLLRGLLLTVLGICYTLFTIDVQFVVLEIVKFCFKNRFCFGLKLFNLVCKF